MGSAKYSHTDTDTYIFDNNISRIHKKVVQIIEKKTDNATDQKTYRGSLQEKIHKLLKKKKKCSTLVIREILIKTTMLYLSSTRMATITSGDNTK